MFVLRGVCLHGCCFGRDGTQLGWDGGVGCGSGRDGVVDLRNEERGQACQSCDSVGRLELLDCLGLLFLAVMTGGWCAFGMYPD